MRTFLLTALASMLFLGGANAQPQEIKRDLGDFNVLPKGLTTDGVAKAYIIEKESRDKATFKVLDESLNAEKTFEVPLSKNSWHETNKTWKYTVEVSKEDLKNAQFVREEGEAVKKSNSDYMGYKYTDTVYCGSMDELKAIVRSGFYRFLSENTDDSDFFVDQNGNWSVLNRSRMSYGTWNGAIGITDCALKPSENIETPSNSIHASYLENYYYYNRTDSCMYEAKRIMEYDRELSDADFSLYTSQEYNRYHFDELKQFKIVDADNAGGIRLDQYITQNILNDDDKYEYIVGKPFYEYKGTTATLECSKGISNWEVTKNVYENTYDFVSYELEAINEDGDVLFRLSSPYKDTNNPYVYVLNGRKYLCVSGYDEKGSGSIIYLINPNSPDGLKEVARTKSTDVTKTYNAAGVQVDKDAKGLVITDNGMKYINR